MKSYDYQYRTDVCDVGYKRIFNKKQNGFNEIENVLHVEANLSKMLI